MKFSNPVAGVRRRWGVLTAIVVASALGLASVGVWADPTGPSVPDKYITIQVVKLLAREHLSRHPLDGEIAQRMLKLFLKTLDPQKMYFYQSDVDNLVQHQGELVDKARHGDVSPAYAIFKLYLQRMDERLPMIDQVLATVPDFTLHEEMVVDREATQYPVTEADAREKWRKRIKYEMLVLKAEEETGSKGDKDKTAAEKAPKPGKFDPAAAKEKLARRYHSLVKRTHQTDNEELLEYYLTSLSSSFDPHTDYMSPSTEEDFAIQMRLELEGIGAALKFSDGYTLVDEIIPGGAADKDKRLKAGDKIVGVGQNDGGITDVVDIKLRDVVKLIRGPRGTVVRLQVVSPGSPERKIYAITREKIELTDKAAQAKVFEQGRRPDGQPYRVGVIDLPSFYMDMDAARKGVADFRSTTRDVHKILEDFKTQGVDAVVLDLRRNGGGSLTEAINLSAQFVGDGPVVQVKGTDSRVQPFSSDQERGVTWSGPLVVLISKFSASASEILAGAIQDYHRGLIVGDHTTHGKGTVQSLLSVGEQFFRVPNAPSLGSLKITMQQFYRPNGDSTQRRGVAADVELPSLTSHLDVGESDLDYATAFDRVEPARFPLFNFTNPELVKELTEWSVARCGKSPDFQRELRNIAHYKQQKQRKTVTLNEKEFMAEWAEINADKEEEKAIRGSEHSKIERDYYMNEALAITGDYLGLLNTAGQVRIAGPSQVPAVPRVAVPQ
jgi:carboxyl-terminal processing protease